jgi:hypothetical protein
MRQSRKSTAARSAKYRICDAGCVPICAVCDRIADGLIAERMSVF